MRRFLAVLLLLLTLSAAAQGNVPIVPDTAAEILLLDMWGSGSAAGVAFAPNGKLLAVATSAGVRLYETGAFGEPDTLDPLFAANSVAFSPADGTLAAVPFGYSVRIYDTFSAETLQETYPPELASPLGEVAYSPDGTRLATNAGADLLVLDAETHVVLFTAPGHIARIHAIHYSPDGARILTVSDDMTANLWEAETGTHLYTISNGESGISDATFAPDGVSILTVSADGAVAVWDENGVPSPVASVDEALTSVAASPHGAVALGSATGAVYLVEDGVAVALGSHVGEIAELAFAQSGMLLASLSAERVTLWDVAAGAEIASAVFETSYVSLSLDDTGATLTAVGASGGAYYFDTQTGMAQGSADTPVTMPPVTSQAFSADGTLSAFSTADGEVIVRADTGDTAYLGAVGRINTLVFSPDGQALAAGTSDGYVEIWRIDAPDAPTGHAEEFFGEVTSLAYSPDGTLLAVSSLDSTVRLLDAATGERYVMRYDHNAAVNDVVFSPDGTRLYSAAANGTIIVWGIPQ